MPLESRIELAEDRTDLAEDRTVLANERTFAGWVRTGYAGIGIGLAFNALFNRMEPSWAPRAIATAFLLLAVVIFIAAERRACAVLDRLTVHQVKSAGRSGLRLIALVSIVATAALIAAIWLVRFDPPA